jgi:hypothetical protein
MSLFDSASLVVTPNGVKEGKLYSIKPTDGSGDLTVTRATSATRVDANGLVEIPRTNLLLQSQTFDNASWTKTNGTITANSIISPSGTLTADTFTTSNVNATIVQNATFQNPCTFSIYVKYIDSQFIQLYSGISGQTIANFDILNGVLGNKGTDTSNSTIESVGNGWYKLTATFINNSGASNIRIKFVASLTSGWGTASTNAINSAYLWGAQLEQGVSATEYIPTVASIRTKFAGITQDGSSASNIPRLDYTNGSCPSILVEPQRTNLALRSEEFNISPWSTLGTTTITANTTTSPSGNLTADLILGADSFSSVNQIISGTTGVVYTNSFYIKNNNSTQSRLTIRNTITAVECNINWTGSLLSSITNLTGTTTFQDAGNGWYRIISTYTAIEAPQRPRIIPTQTTNQSVYVWGAQLEAGANATSYIPTTSATVTRNADLISKTGISSLIGQTEGTIYAEIKVNKLIGTASRYIFHLSDGTVNNRIYMAFSGSSSNVLRARIFNGGTLQCSIDTSALTNTGTYKLALAYKNNDIVFYVNGVQIGTDTSATIPTCSRVDLGQNYANASQLGDGINNANIWKTRLTNAELATLTTI